MYASVLIPYLKQTTMHMAMMTAMIMIKKTATAAATALAEPPPSVGSASPSNLTTEQMNYTLPSHVTNRTLKSDHRKQLDSQSTDHA